MSDRRRRADPLFPAPGEGREPSPGPVASSRRAREAPPDPAGSSRPARGDPCRGRARSFLPALGAVLLVLAAGGCDNIVKHVPVFATMVDEATVETYEQPPTPPPEGAVPVDGRRGYTLNEADSLLTNPLEGTAEQILRGRTGYRQFCLPCHGATGEGDGPVMNVGGEQPRRLPRTPAANLTTGTGLERSDGYVWGMIENGRGLMPDYARLPRDARWELVEYLRHLQRLATGDTTAVDRAVLGELAGEGSPEASARGPSPGSAGAPAGGSSPVPERAPGAGPAAGAAPDGGRP